MLDHVEEPRPHLPGGQGGRRGRTRGQLLRESSTFVQLQSVSSLEEDIALSDFQYTLLMNVKTVEAVYHRMFLEYVTLV